jgi:hypothetical protein
MKSNLCLAMQNAPIDTYQFMVNRYPRLVRAMQWVAILSSGEAGCALRDYVYARDGVTHANLMRWGGGEAVSHFGGPLRVIRRAIETRAILRTLRRR